MHTCYTHALERTGQHVVSAVLVVAVTDTEVVQGDAIHQSVASELVQDAYKRTYIGSMHARELKYRHIYILAYIAA